LRDEAFNVAMPDVELRVLGQGYGPYSQLAEAWYWAYCPVKRTIFGMPRLSSRTRIPSVSRPHLLGRERR
jgi:hypothetical protein